MATTCKNCDGHADANGNAWRPFCHPPEPVESTPVCPDFTAPTTDRIGKWVQPAYALPAMSLLVPLWSNWKTLELGSREPIDGDGGWLWTPADGDSEKFADLTVVAWFDLPACGDVATPDPRDAEIAALKATIAGGEQAWIVVQKHSRRPSIIKAWGKAQALWTFYDHDAAVRFLGHGVLPSLRDAYEVREVSVTILPREVSHG